MSDTMLTDKQENFCINIALKGMTQIDAYKNAYDAENMGDDTIYVAASNLMSNHKISIRINELREKAESTKIMSAIQRKEWLTNMVLNDVDANKTDKLKALDILNKMTGEYTTKLEGNIQLSYEDKLKEMTDEDED